MKKIAYSMVALAILLTAASGVSAKSDKAKGPVDKATGSVMWESGAANVIRHLDFNAHELDEDTNEAKGMAHYMDENGNTFDVNVEGAMIDGDHACFWGETTEATGAFESRVGQTRYWYVVDGGEPEDDAIRGRWSSSTNEVRVCRGLSISPFDVLEGNLQVHTM